LEKSIPLNLGQRNKEPKMSAIVEEVRLRKRSEV
jgi:hypothetical protein